MRTLACAGMAALAGSIMGGPAMAAPPPAPKLIVAISVDQFSADLYNRYRARFTGGLKRLGDGLAFTGYQSHAATETCPGHSTILTGDHPARTGIVANTWFDAATGSNIYCVSVAGTSDPDARGPQNLRVDTLGDWLKKAKPGARSFAVSGKDRAAITMGGHHADGVYWWVDGVGFTTSSFAGPATPAITQPAVAYDKALFARWKASPPALWTEVPAACIAEEQPHQFGKITLSGKVPPDMAASVETGDFLARTDFQDFLHATPLFDGVVAEFAEQVIDREKLGHGPTTDIIAISFSATDYVGHRYGPGGAEMCTQMAALDRTLGQLLAKLDSLGVPYVVALTADHGGTDAAERAAEHGLDAHRLDPAAFVGALNKALMAQLGLGFEPIVGDDPQQLSINVGPDSALRAKVRDAAVAWLRARTEVVTVLTADETAAAVPPKGKPVTDLTVAERFHESYDPRRSGDIQVEYRQYTTVGMPRGPGDYVSGHGSPWDHDRRVPILFWWPGAPAEMRKEPIETVDIAPTLAAIAGLPAPDVDGKCLPQVAGTCPSP